MAGLSWTAPITKLLKSVSQRGVRGTAIQLYTIGDIKFGDLRGTDRWGNKYYENLDYPFGQHRWVEYADIHDPDPTMIPPEWHGWMHHTYDETPDETTFEGKFLKTTEESDVKINTHLGHIADRTHENFPTHNLSQYRLRGYKTESIFVKPGEPEQFYKQPGHPTHPLAEKGGRFKHVKGYNVWDKEETMKEEEEKQRKKREEFEKYSKN